MPDDVHRPLAQAAAGQLTTLACPCFTRADEGTVAPLGGPLKASFHTVLLTVLALRQPMRAPQVHCSLSLTGVAPDPACCDGAVVSRSGACAASSNPVSV